MDTQATARQPCPQLGAAPSNPPPQRRAILRSVSGMIASDPNRMALSPLLTGGGSRRAVCVPVFFVPAF